MVIRQSGASCGHICPALSLLAVSSGCLQTAAVANGTAENMGCQCLLAMCPEVTAQKWTAGAHGSCFLGCEASSVPPPPHGGPKHWLVLVFLIVVTWHLLVLICTCLMLGDVEHFFLCLLAF